VSGGAELWDQGRR